PVIYQFVTLTRHGEQVKMSTRRAEYVTLDELLDEVGVDAARFFFLMRKSDSHLEFDLDLAKQQSTDNPVFYVQYAYARIASVLRQAAESGIPLAAEPDLSPLGDPEVEVVRAVASYPDVVETAARDLEPHRVVFHALDLAGAFHRYYNRQRILTEDRALTQARSLGEQQVMRLAVTSAPPPGGQHPKAEPEFAFYDKLMGEHGPERAPEPERVREEAKPAPPAEPGLPRQAAAATPPLAPVVAKPAR